MIYKIAASRLDREIANAIKKAEYKRAIKMIKKVYGNEAGRKANIDLINNPNVSHFTKLLVAHSAGGIKDNLRQDIQLGKDIMNGYKKPLRDLYKMKDEYSYLSIATEPRPDINKRNRLYRADMLKEKANARKKGLNFATVHNIDPEKEIYISHGGTEEHLEDFFERGRGAVRDISGYGNSKGIWVHPNLNEDFDAFRKRERFYAQKAAIKTGLTPLRFGAKVKAKYLQAAPNSYEAFLPVEHRNKVKILHAERPTELPEMEEAIEYYKNLKK